VIRFFALLPFVVIGEGAQVTANICSLIIRRPVR